MTKHTQADILKALKSQNKGNKFKQFAEAEDLYGSPLPDGTYIGQVGQMSISLDAKNNPRCIIKVSIIGGDHDGRIVSIFHNLFASGKRTIENAYSYLSIDVQRMGYDVSEVTSEDILLELCEQISQDKPVIRLSSKLAEGQSMPNVKILGVEESGEYNAIPQEDDAQEEVNEIIEEEPQEEIEVIEEVEEEVKEPPKTMVKKAHVPPPGSTPVKKKAPVKKASFRK